MRAGAQWVQGTINGMGERAGNASLGEVALALDALYGSRPGCDLERLRETSELVRARSGYALDPWKPLTGETLFVRESGAVASQFHDPPAIEPYAADSSARSAGSCSARRAGSTRSASSSPSSASSGPRSDWPALLAAVKELARRGAPRAHRRGVAGDRHRGLTGDRARLHRRRRDDRQPAGGASRHGLRGRVLTRRPEHAAALVENGLRISGKHELVAQVFATTDPAELADFDVGIFACKALDLD